MRNTTIILLLFINFICCLASVHKKPIDSKKEKKILEIVYNLLKSKHLIDKKIDDNFSKKVFKSYLELVDEYKIFLLQSDITEFKKFETQIDDQLKNNDLTFFYLTYDRLKTRMIEGKQMYTNLLKNKIDIRENDGYFDEKNRHFLKTKYEQSKEWRKFIKSEVFSRVIETCEEENADKRLNEQRFNEIFDEAANSFLGNFLSRVEVTYLNIDNVDRELIFENYLNAIIYQYDVHSKYMIPRTRDEYLFKQTGKSVGIGVLTQVKDNFVQIRSVNVGGPAWKSKKIDPEDIILKVAQENNEPVDVVGFSLYETAKLTRGKSGTIVKLTLKKSNGAIEEVAIKRGIVSTNDSYIKSCLVEKNKIKYAVLAFPRFYNDFEDEMSRNASNDFEEELQILNESGVEGIVLDIRQNEGGSVDEAVKILSNLIEKKTILQVKNKQKQISKFESLYETKKFDKGIVLLVDSQTASAAEIFASAFQDFNIGVVIGRATFGKGTVQEFIDLNMFNSRKEINDDYGLLKLTTQQFYRPNGNSVQKTSVMPDVVFAQESAENREKDMLNALNQDQIAASDFKQDNERTYFKKIISSEVARLENNLYFKTLLQVQPQLDFYSDFVKINYEILKKELYKYIEIRNEINKLKIFSNLEFKSTPADVKLFKRNEYLVSKRKNWYNELKSDLIIEEAINILEDVYIKK